MLYASMVWLFWTSPADPTTRLLMLVEPVVMIAVLIGVHRLSYGHTLFPWMMSYFFLAFGLLLVVSLSS